MIKYMYRIQYTNSINSGFLGFIKLRAIDQRLHSDMMYVCIMHMHILHVKNMALMHTYTLRPHLLPHTQLAVVI